MTFHSLVSAGFSTCQILELLLRIFVACLCGAAIGLERTKRYKEAGIRTHCVITCASAALMIVSKYGFVDLMAGGVYLIGTDGADPSRIAAQIVSGVGFLGAGMIFKNGNSIRGLTSAAGIWASAAVGMIIGSGLYSVGVFLTFIVLAVLLGVRFLNVDNEVSSNTKICATLSGDASDRDAFFSGLTEKNFEILDTKLIRREGCIDVELTVRSKARISEEKLFQIFRDIPQVRSIST